jgi:hypothetical protein
MKTLTGENIGNEEIFRIVYSGDTFSDGLIPLHVLQTELKSLESIVNRSIEILIRTGKLTKYHKKYDVFILIEKGSIMETVKIIFKNPISGIILTAIVGPLITTTYEHFLNSSNNTDQFKDEIQLIQGDKNYKNDLKQVLSPLSGNNDNIIINHGTINLTISTEDKKTIEKQLDVEEYDVDILKDGIFDETLQGVIRKLDLDAHGANYFGFTVDGGETRVPTSVASSFNLNDYRDILGEHVVIKAHVKYKDGEMKHIEILSYELLGIQSSIKY